MRDGEGAADGKCEHKIRQMKTNCARARARPPRVYLSFGVVRSLPCGGTTPLRRHESEVHRTAARHAQGYFTQESGDMCALYGAFTLDQTKGREFAYQNVLIDVFHRR